jgi:inorganic pyrophosphatase/exopolyphosphatase
LRTEIIWFLKENGSHMIFLDDIDLNELYNQEKLEIILVDHHSLNSKFNEIIIEIIDHHQIEKDSIKLQEYIKKQYSLKYNFENLFSIVHQK